MSRKGYMGLTPEEVERIVASDFRRLKSLLSDAFTSLASDITLTRVATYDGTYDADGLLSELPWGELVAQLGDADEIFKAVAKKVGDATIPTIPTLADTSYSFTLTNPRALTHLAVQGADFVTNISGSTREALRARILEAYRTGEGGPRDIARTLRPLVGLDLRQMRAVENFRSRLAASGLNAETQRRTLERYIKRKHIERTERIARHEIVQAGHTGQYALWEEAMAMGFLPRSVRVRWITATDDRVCPICAPLDGTTVGFRQQFQVVLERPRAGPIEFVKTEPPIHIQCRCGIALDADSMAPTGPIGRATEMPIRTRVSDYPRAKRQRKPITVPRRNLRRRTKKMAVV